MSEAEMVAKALGLVYDAMHLPGGIWCQECFIFTNHSTDEHEAAAAEGPGEPTR